MTKLPDLANLDLDTQKPPRLQMSEAEFDEFVKQCDENFWVEWVDGEVIMTPPASAKHVLLAGFILQIVAPYVRRRKLGIALGPELQIRHEEMHRRRVPDVIFISNERKHLLKPMYIEGAPDLVVEIVSESSVKRDWHDKYLEYEAMGVREYWVIDATSDEVQAYTLNRRRYARIGKYRGMIRSKVIDGFYLKPEWLWQEPLPDTLDILKELGVL